MPWLELRLDVAPAAMDAMSDALLEAGAQSVDLEAGRLSVILALAQDPHALVAAAARAARIEPPGFSTRRIDDQDWVRASQAQFPGMAVGRRLWIGPTWREAPRGRIAVRIDPGLAFGTGSHASTKLALDFLDRVVAGGERVLDYGCGSGILGIAAAKLGAARVDAIDLDPQAVETAAANARLNAVGMTSALPEALPEGTYDIVVANILAQPLIALAPLLARRAARIALSGILEDQAGEVVRAYAPWLELRVEATEERWVLLAGVRA